MNVQDFILDPKDAQRILIGANGKLGPMEFARGLVAIVAVALVLNLLSLFPLIGGLLGLVVGLLLAFCWVCVFSKRFHDAGQSGWMTVGAVVVGIVLSVVVSIILTPIFGGVDYSSMGSVQTISAGFALKNMISTIIVNAALGYYMFKLKPVLL